VALLAMLSVITETFAKVAAAIAEGRHLMRSPRQQIILYKKNRHCK